MPTIFRDDYGKKPMPDGEPGYMEITPTKQKFWEPEGTDVRLNRVRLFNDSGEFLRSFLQDQLGVRFKDNLPNTEDDPGYVVTLPERARR